jgi:hypothetical protein
MFFIIFGLLMAGSGAGFVKIITDSDTVGPNSTDPTHQDPMVVEHTGILLQYIR